MRVIDLLNKIANNEEMPEKIIIYTKYGKSYGMELSSSMRNYKNGDGDLLFSSDYDWLDMLNDEVEVIETPKFIKKLDIYDELTSNNKLHTYMKINTSKCAVSEVQKEIIVKLNEIIDKLNEVE